ncbi:response regulator transcription factor [Synechococcus sp. A15-60]|uniref:response regulator transcription factor n=1 Tax=Synechococcus sp. A15-60 TaxID=1050655 RepID=UPI001644FC04|nr:helix-turn-helix transcriptional regulator [Synechococcus sp. A15-60]QNI47256.1 transcriptional regulator/ LuxR family [Synechococcus sp. A15-60]
MASFNLTPAEVAVLNLLLQGMSNRSIAAARLVSIRTVESHISHALDKSGCQSRLQLTLWWMQQRQSLEEMCTGKVPPLPA